MKHTLWLLMVRAVCIVFYKLHTVKTGNCVTLAALWFFFLPSPKAGVAPCIPAGAGSRASCAALQSAAVWLVFCPSLRRKDGINPLRLSPGACSWLTALPFMHSTGNYRAQCMKQLFYPLQLCFPLRERVIILFLFQCQVPHGLCICLFENMFCFDVCFSNGASLHNTFCCKRMLNLQMSYHF